MKPFFKSPILYAILGVVLIIIGNIYNNKDKYPYMTFWSRLMIVAGAAAVGFSAANILRWNPLTRING